MNSELLYFRRFQPSYETRGQQTTADPEHSEATDTRIALIHSQVSEQHGTHFHSISQDRESLTTSIHHRQLTDEHCALETQSYVYKVAIGRANLTPLTINNFTEQRPRDRTTRRTSSLTRTILISVVRDFRGAPGGRTQRACESERDGTTEETRGKGRAIAKGESGKGMGERRRELRNAPFGKRTDTTGDE